MAQTGDAPPVPLPTAIVETVTATPSATLEGQETPLLTETPEGDDELLPTETVDGFPTNPAPTDASSLTPTSIEVTELPTIEPTEQPAELQLIAPVEGTVLESENVTFSWTAIPDAKWYRIRIDKGNKKSWFVKRFREVSQICAEGICSVDLDQLGIELPEGKRFRWQIFGKLGEDVLKTKSWIFFNPEKDLSYGNWLLLSTDKFNPPNITSNNWHFRQNWKIVTSSDSPHILGYDSPNSALFKYKNLGDFAFQTKIKISTGGFGLRLRNEDSQDTFVYIYDSGRVLIDSSAYSLSRELTSWNKIRVELRNNELILMVGGEKLINHKFTTLFRVSELAIISDYRVNSEFQLDNIKVWRSGYETHELIDSTLNMSRPQQLDLTQADNLPSQIAFRYCTDVFNCQLKAYDGGSIYSLTDSLVDNNSHGFGSTLLTWSSNGRYIGFVGYDLAFTVTYEILDLLTSQVISSEGQGGLQTYCVDFSSNSSEIVFSDYGQGTWPFKLHYLNVDGTRTQTSATSDGLMCPEWSPVDDRWIAYIESNETSRVKILNRETGTTQTVYNPGGYVDPPIHWSPDGTKLAFGTDSPGFVYILDLSTCINTEDGCDSSETTLIRTYGGIPDQNNYPPYAWFESFSWNHAGTKIAIEGDYGIYVVDIAEQSISENDLLSHSRSGDLLPQWSPDDKWIAVAAAKDPQSTSYWIVDTNIQVLSVNDPTKRQQVTQFGSEDGGASFPLWEPLPPTCTTPTGGSSLASVQNTGNCPAPEVCTSIVNVSTANAKLRSTPEALDDSNVIAYIPDLSAIVLVAILEDETWYQVDYNGTIGWLASSVVEYRECVDSLPRVTVYGETLTPTMTPTPTLTPTLTPTSIYSATPLPTATTTLTPTPTSIPCLGIIMTSDNVYVRERPWGNVIGSLPNGTQVNLSGGWYYEDIETGYSEWWWKIETPNIEGYVHYLLVHDVNQCARNLIEPPPIPVPVFNSACMITLNDGSTANIFNGLNQIVGTISDTDPIRAYGVSHNYERYLISIPGATITVNGIDEVDQQWVNRSLFRFDPSYKLACDTSVLGRFREAQPQEVDYWKSVGTYANTFAAPVSFSTNIYEVFRNSQKYYDGGHDGIDLVYGPPDGRGDAVPFPVQAQANGVVVEAGPSGVVGRWILQNPTITTNPFEGRAGTVFYPETGTLYFAVTWDQDFDDTNDESESPVTSWPECPGCTPFGLLQKEIQTMTEPDIETGKVAYNFIGSDRCSQYFKNIEDGTQESVSPGKVLPGCVRGADRQVIIWYEGDSDPSPDIQTIYYHVNPYLNDNYNNWNTNCSSKDRLSTWNLKKLQCSVNQATIFGDSKWQGWSSAVHLHYEVFIDRSDSTGFKYSEREDPLMAFQTFR